MTDAKVQVEVKLTPNSPLQIQAPAEDKTDEEVDTKLIIPELGDSLEELAGVAVAPSCGEQRDCSPDCAAWACQELRLMDRLPSIRLQLHVLMSKIDDFISHLVSGQEDLDKESFAALVPTFLYSCQPYFTYLESTARSSAPQPSYIRSGLLDFSQQLCDRLEQLVLTCASYNLLCLDETKPDSVSHFYIGQCHTSRLKLTMFWYCKPMPFQARANTGLYKRMRWNVERLGDDEQQQADEEQEGERETVGDTEYYFLCYEDVPKVQTEDNIDRQDGDGDGGHGNVERMWSIGLWVQVNPDPDTEDIYDWILCEVPEAKYMKLLCLGSEEPSTCIATDLLLGLLLSQETTGKDGSASPDCT
ncbi:UPF0575 protein C19orf67 homolog isoform X2 [Myripristis murdjan]|uniref:UPF0575 protein C19orf67 homolog isoform X2 n=1 Tax=Myripristis murdjan TaxID=586833 RepID=UPI0011762805|nr:UPF0575 protein C19orf67 homolog isoform X2 [Myripristis murdjan]